MSAGDRAHTHSHAHSGSYLKKPKYANVSVCFHTYLIYWLGIVLRSGGIHAHTHTVCLVLCFWIGHVKIKRFWHINSVSGMWCGVCVCVRVWRGAKFTENTLLLWLCEWFFFLLSFVLAYKLAHYDHSKKVTFMLQPKPIWNAHTHRASERKIANNSNNKKNGILLSSGNRARSML